MSGLRHGSLEGQRLDPLISGKSVLLWTLGQKATLHVYKGPSSYDEHHCELEDGYSTVPLAMLSYIGEQTADGWISWAGGENPAGETRDMEFKGRDGNVWINHARNVRWDHKGWDTDIIAFRYGEAK